MAFFCADEPEACTWPLAPPQSIALVAAAEDEPAEAPVPPLSSEPHAVRVRAPQAARAPRARARRFMRWSFTKEFLPSAAVLFGGVRGLRTPMHRHARISTGYGRK
ncbi:hypothetical protein GCM10010512_39700 [Streptomyces thermoviolaceus subsp. thermoviolaceus]|nr:hypothetical protein GCM10010512_39700 [Streptomyces thermoviolaceus subsp. thermoviolaceus]